MEAYIHTCFSAPRKACAGGGGAWGGGGRETEILPLLKMAPLPPGLGNFKELSRDPHPELDAEPQVGQDSAGMFWLACTPDSPRGFAGRPPSCSPRESVLG